MSTEELSLSRPIDEHTIDYLERAMAYRTGPDRELFLRVQALGFAAHAERRTFRFEKGDDPDPDYVGQILADADRFADWLRRPAPDAGQEDAP